jgi:hypothetical protein
VNKIQILLPPGLFTWFTVPMAQPAEEFIVSFGTYPAKTSKGILAY